MKEFYREYLLISLLPVAMIIYAISTSSLPEIFLNLDKLVHANDILVSDYFAISSISATFFNSAIATLVNIYIMYKMRLKLNGLLVSAIFLMTSFSFMGKNIYNIIPFYVGVMIYSKIYKRKIKVVIPIAMMSSTLAPVVSSLGVVGILLGILVGYLMPFIIPNALHYHNGYSLYNTGLAGGLLGIIIYSLISAMGIKFDLNKYYYEKFDYRIFFFFLIYFIFLIIYGVYRDKNIVKNMKAIYRHTGRLVTDFIQKEGFYATLVNMGSLGLFCLAISYYYQVLNGPVICGMLTVVAFGGFGKHLKNIIPLVIGVIIAENIFKIDINTSIFVMSIFFSTTLAPIAGKFGIIIGILVGILQYAMSVHIGVIHGGINLYNNGLSAGIVASVAVPILESILGGINDARAKKESRKNDR